MSWELSDLVARYAVADFCQGHGGRCTTCFDPETGCDDDHGVVSYCDGTCPDGRWEYLRYLRENGLDPDATTDYITLEVEGQGSSYLVRFDGPDAQARALAYVEARWSTHYINDVPWEPFSYEAYPRLADKLNPTCVHGLSEWLCADPINHYPPDL